jgi:L-ribulose-5-phosphate 3-epimerase
MRDSSIGRRDFVKRTAAVTIGAGLAGATSGSRAADAPFDPLPKAVQINMLPQDLSDSEKFTLAKSCGFDGIEANPIDDLAAAKEQGELARAAGVPIHSIVFGGWRTPFSDPGPAVVEKGLHAMETALRSAQAMGADTVLLVPAVVTERVRYADAYARSQQHIRKLLPVAEETSVVIAVENVWNKFLLSPIEFARYVDEFESPWLRAYFDVGNVVAFGYPEDWIRTLGKRIVKVHLKDFRRGPHEWAPLREGDVDWPEVRRALAEVGYTGFITCELQGGDEAYLRDVSARMSRIAIGE